MKSVEKWMRNDREWERESKREGDRELTKNKISQTNSNLIRFSLLQFSVNHYLLRYFATRRVNDYDKRTRLSFSVARDAKKNKILCNVTKN